MSTTLEESMPTTSLASHKGGAEPPDDALLTGHLPELISFGRNSVRASSSCPPSLDEEDISSAYGKQQSLANRLKRALRFQKHSSKNPAEYSYDCKLEQIIPKLDHYPVGYGKLAAIEDCDPDFLIYRKFGWLRNCALLHLQDELVELEEDLEALDGFEFVEEPRRLYSRRQNEGPDGIERRELLKQIRSKLAEYGELAQTEKAQSPDISDESLFRLQKIQALRRPTERNQKSLANFIFNTGSQAAEESDWIRVGTDLAAVAHDQEHGWLIGFLEDTLLKISRKAAIVFFRTREQNIISGQEPITLLSASRLDILLRSVLTICASVLLLTPVFILFKLQPRRQADVERNTYCQILVIFLFTLAFSALCSVFTKARRQEVFAATAGYCAVLIVFLGNTGSLVMTSPG